LVAAATAGVKGSSGMSSTNYAPCEYICRAKTPAFKAGPELYATHEYK
jgi:hypothetical protein